MTTRFVSDGDRETSTRLYRLVRQIAELPDVKGAVEANHDENQWWPTSVNDPRVRMLLAGWSTRVSYTMVRTYARVVADADALGWERILNLADAEVVNLVGSLGLANARLGYLRSLSDFLTLADAEDLDLLSVDADALISRFAAQVANASFKVAQCAVLYSRGYHCGLIPVDSGMVTKLAPAIGLHLRSGSIAHEQMRRTLEVCLQDRADDYRELIEGLGYEVVLPRGARPSWWLHLVLIYFKRLYLNRPNPHLCSERPLCEEIVGCGHSN